MHLFRSRFTLEWVANQSPRIRNKGGRNTREPFASRTVIERETSSGKPTDAWQAFANLFKK